MKFNKEPFLSDYAKMWIENGIIHTAYTPDLVVTLPIAKQIVADRIEYTEGILYPGLADVRNGKKADNAAMKYWATSDAYLGLSALSVYSNSRLTNLFVNFWLKVDKPHRPTKCFSNLEHAYLFLQPYMYNN